MVYFQLGFLDVSFQIGSGTSGGTVTYRFSVLVLWIGRVRGES